MLFGRYLAEFPAIYASYYGGLASAMMALVFLYLTSTIFVFGGELNAAILRSASSRPRPSLTAKFASRPHDSAPRRRYDGACVGIAGMIPGGASKGRRRMVESLLAWLIVGAHCRDGSRA